MGKYNISPDFIALTKLHMLKSLSLIKVVNVLSNINFFVLKVLDGLEQEIKDITTPNCGSLKLVIFEPKEKVKSRNCLVYYAGGGYMSVPAFVHKHNAMIYALNAKCKVIMVLYRLAPKFAFPTALLDAYDGLQYVYENAGHLGIDKNKIIVGGDSAGGELAASVALMARDKGEINPIGQMLIYPAFDDIETLSRKNYTDVPMFNSKDMEFVKQHYYKNGIAEDMKRYAYPMKHKNKKDLPTAYIETAEFDSLHDEGVAYAEKLREAGVSVTLNETKGTIHGYDAVTRSSISLDSVARRTRFLIEQFDKSSVEE